MDTATPTPPTSAAPEISVPRRTPSGLLEALEAHALAETTSPEEARRIQGNIAHVSHGIDARLRGGFITPEQTRDILGDKLFRGAESANALYGINLTPDIVAQVPFKFTKGEAENAFRLKTPISLHVKEFGHGESAKPSTMRNLNDTQQGKALYDYNKSWYKDEDFAVNATDKLEWRQTTPNVVPGTLERDFLERTDLQIKFLKEEIFKGLPLPATYEKAIQELDQKRAEIEPLLKNWDRNHKTAKLPNGQPAPNWYVAAEMLEKLQIVTLLRPTPASIMQDITNMKSVGVNMLESTYTDTSVRSSDGVFAIVGGADGLGADVLSCRPSHRYDNLGSSLSRSLSE